MLDLSWFLQIKSFILPFSFIMFIRNKVCLILCNLLILMAKSENLDEKTPRKSGNFNLGNDGSDGGWEVVETSLPDSEWDKKFDPDQNMFHHHEGVVTSLIRDELRFEPASSNIRIELGKERIRRQTECLERGKWLFLVSYTGLPLRIPCNPCETTNGVTWTKESRSGNVREIDFDDQFEDRRLERDSAIYIPRAVQQDEGTYRCKKNGVVIGTYRVEIKVEVPGEIHVVRPLEVGGGHEFGDVIENGHRMLYTKWSEWGSCSECERGRAYGERARIGYCYAISHAFQEYPLGIPCSTKDYPVSILREFTRGRTDEKMFEACGERCQGSEFEEEEFGCVERDKWIALVFYTGLPLRIPCNPCETAFGVTWTKESRSVDREIEFDDPYDDNRRVILGGDSAIYILRAEQQDEGIYRCEMEEVFTSENSDAVVSTIGTYRVEIKAPGEIHVVRPPEVGGDGATEEFGNAIKNGRLQMYTKWSEWGSCSDCERGRTYGERARMGYCYALIPTLLHKYPLGVPCSAKEIPESMRRQVTGGRTDEKMFEACGGQCPDDSLERNLTIFAQLLGKGRIQEEPVEGHEGAYIVLICPGLEIDSAVMWQNGTKIIDAEYLFESRGRVHIDIYDGLQIFRLHKRDQQPYHCYVDGKRRATFRLYVTKELVDPNEILESFIYIGILIGIYFIVFLIIMLAKHNVRRRSRVKKVHIPADI